MTDCYKCGKKIRDSSKGIKPTGNEANREVIIKEELRNLCAECGEEA